VRSPHAPSSKLMFGMLARRGHQRRQLKNRKGFGTPSRGSSEKWDRTWGARVMEAVREHVAVAEGESGRRNPAKL
jgi:hypothetical protein